MDLGKTNSNETILEKAPRAEFVKILVEFIFGIVRFSNVIFGGNPTFVAGKARKWRIENFHSTNSC